MHPYRRFTVRPVLPESLSGLHELVANLRWAWHAPTQQLFASLDPESWERVRHNPYALLNELSATRLHELAQQPAVVAQIEGLLADLNDYLQRPLWFQQYDGAKPTGIAYFSPEFGIAAAVPQYSGGLGILAGDHLKSASDLGLPLVGVGLFYAAGYFSQGMSADGWQVESYPPVDAKGLAFELLREHDGSIATVSLALPGAELRAQIWLARVGRIPLLMLDTNMPENPEALRGVTDRLYGGGSEHRLQQELLLGIGGARALVKWAEVSGREVPEVFHMNEGHAGFSAVERIATLVQGGLDVQIAYRAVRAGTVFTTHTPVPAGIDRFDLGLIQHYLEADVLPGLPVDWVLELGAETDPNAFNMAHMGLRLAAHANGVSQLHGEVSREMFGALWPGFETADVPIGSVTNGVHAPTWVDPRLAEIASVAFDTADTTVVDWTSPAVSDQQLWEAKQQMRAHMVEDARARTRATWESSHSGAVAPAWIDGMLSSTTLTIGFARRAATYKRLALMLQDPERLTRILTNPERPVQLVIAGKAHPADDDGKRLIQQLIQFAADPVIRNHIVFLPDYNIGMAQTLYPGCDVWMNTPLRPLEACGTSGMKAAMNGALNLSILDGWWAEFCDDQNGWAIPTADGVGDPVLRDQIEAAGLYDLIEHQVVPQFYERTNGVPAVWLRKLRHTLATLSPALSANRMVQQYTVEYYAPASALAQQATADNFTLAADFAHWAARLTQAWPKVAVHELQLSAGPEYAVGEALTLQARIALDGLDAEDVRVDAYVGRAGGEELLTPSTVALSLQRQDGSDWIFAGSVELEHAGSVGCAVRVVPQHALQASPAELGLVRWA